MSDEKNRTSTTDAREVDPTEVSIEDLAKFSGGTMKTVTKDRTHGITQAMKENV